MTIETMDEEYERWKGDVGEWMVFAPSDASAEAYIIARLERDGCVTFKCDDGTVWAFKEKRPRLEYFTPGLPGDRP